jgi:hypothetical protein
MTLLYQRKELEIPEPEGSEAKEVFAFFGLCSYNSQVLERGLVNLAVGLKALGFTKLTEENLDSLFERTMRKTLGQLIADVRPHVNVSKELENEIMETLNDRNYIIHRFFAEHDISFMSDHGRSNMINELRSILKRIRKIDHELELIAHSLWRRLGLTEEIFQKGLDEMSAEAKQLDKPS